MSRDQAAIQEVGEVVMRLRKYAHSEACEAYLACPLHHEECKSMLGLDTSIAWELANELNAIHGYLTRYYGGSGFDSQHVYKKVEKVSTLADSFGRVLARHGYTTLGAEIDNVHSALALTVGLLNRQLI